MEEEILIALIGASCAALTAGFWAWRRPGALGGKAILPEAIWTRLVTRPRRLRAMRAALPEGLTALAGSLRAGTSLLQGLTTLGEDAPEPLREECLRLMAEQKSGRDLDSSLEALAGRYGLDELNLAVAGIRLSRQAGTDLAGVLSEAASLSRQRIDLGQKISALSAQGVLSGWVMALLAPLLLAALAALDPSFVSPLFDLKSGRFLLGFALFWEGIGAFWISRVIKAAGR